MKKIILFTIILISTGLFSQVMNLQHHDEKRFNWGFYLGVNTFDFAIIPKDFKESVSKYGKVDIYSEPSLGFSIGVTGDLKITKNISLRLEPALHFSQKKIFFNYLEKPIDRERLAKASYLDIPILVKINSNRMNNIRPYISAGAGLLMNLTSNEDSLEDISQGVFRSKKMNFDYQLEFGIEIYFDRFKLTPSIKGIFGVSNELQEDKYRFGQLIRDKNNLLILKQGWTDTIDAFKTRAILFSLKFE